MSVVTISSRYQIVIPRDMSVARSTYASGLTSARAKRCRRSLSRAAWS